MSACFVALALLVLAVPAGASDPVSISEREPENVRELRDAFYCQPWVPTLVWAFSGTESEIADDIPDEFTGQTVRMVTVWVGEWPTDVPPYWVEPLGLALNFYYSECPPDQIPDLHFEIAWSDLIVEIAYVGGVTIYEVTAVLPEAVPIQAHTSIGCHAITDWGYDLPNCGVCVTEEDMVFGCNEFYWHCDLMGVPRWTLCSDIFSFSGDLAYCLWATTASVPDEGPTEGPDSGTTWGSIKHLFR